MSEGYPLGGSSSACRSREPGRASSSSVRKRSTMSYRPAGGAAVVDQRPRRDSLAARSVQSSTSRTRSSFVQRADATARSRVSCRCQSSARYTFRLRAKWIEPVSSGSRRGRAPRAKCHARSEMRIRAPRRQPPWSPPRSSPASTSPRTLRRRASSLRAGLEVLEHEVVCQRKRRGQALLDRHWRDYAARAREGSATVACRRRDGGQTSGKYRLPAS